MLKLKELYFGKFLKRYKRFFVDILFGDEVITLHNPNTGSMKTILERDSLVAFSISDNQKRKLKYTMEGIKVKNHWFYTNTIAVNKIVEAAIYDNEISEFSGFHSVKREFKYKDSRIDFMVKLKNGKNAFIEVKNVTMFDNDFAYFPDATTTRGLKHLNTLSESITDGFIPYMLYVIQSPNDKFKCADFIDKDYCNKLKELKEIINVIVYKNIFKPEKSLCYLEKLNQP
ncbi:MAG: Sugar fermentation stimulation protein [Deferribacteraceae bacterium]|jgi:sugar fermentation stimulation protein A|nr:Sugar fermentation stimulation protein [Deferribacteraceae bacterium]